MTHSNTQRLVRVVYGILHELKCGNLLVKNGNFETKIL
jgi:hypothetical protein